MFEPITYEPHVLFTSNDLVYFMISCRELGLTDPQVVTTDSLIQGKLVPKMDLVSLATCAQLNATKAQIYFSSKYPVKVPVTYFQGTDDSATVAPGAFRHYKTVPQGRKQLLILVRGGHNPNLLNIRAASEGQKEMFVHAFKGEAVPQELLLRVQKAQNLRWTYTSKNF